MLNLGQKSCFLGPTIISKAFNDAYNYRGLLILTDLLNERVAKGVTSDPHDFRQQ